MLSPFWQLGMTDSLTLCVGRSMVPLMARLGCVCKHNPVSSTLRQCAADPSTLSLSPSRGVDLGQHLSVTPGWICKRSLLQSANACASLQAPSGPSWSREQVLALRALSGQVGTPCWIGRLEACQLWHKLCRCMRSKWFWRRSFCAHRTGATRTWDSSSPRMPGCKMFQREVLQLLWWHGDVS